VTTNGWSHFDDFLASVDRDGAIVEAKAVAEASLSRRRLIAVGLAGSGAAFFGRAPGATASNGLVGSDVGILNYALVLE
jgi:hypothetical protein